MHFECRLMRYLLACIDKMQNTFLGGNNPQGSLRIYDPPSLPISNNFFASQRTTALPKSKPYLRQESIIDKLNPREEEEKSPSSQTSLKPTSIQFLVDHEQLLRLQPVKIEDIFANKPALFSQEINSGVLKGEGTLEEMGKNSNSHIVLPSFPSREHISDSPERPNLHKPFLRKKPSVPPQPKSSNDFSFQSAKLEKDTQQLKEHNNHLMSVLRSLQLLQEEGSNEWKQLGRQEMALLKLMVEKAIIAKEDH